jgi:hypothetical protein
MHHPLTDRVIAVPIRHLPPVAIEGHILTSPGSPEHPMRLATRRAAGLDEGGWQGDLRDDVKAYFDAMAGDWHTRTSPERTEIVRDVLARGVESVGVPAGLAVEARERHRGLLDAAGRALSHGGRGRSLAGDVAACADGSRVTRAGGWRLASAPGRNAAAVVLINAFLFPAEVARVLAPDGAIVWVNSSGERTPIYLSPDDLLKALPGDWNGTASRAGEGHWCVLRRSA